MNLHVHRPTACVKTLWFRIFVMPVLLGCLYFLHINRLPADTEIGAVADLLEAGEYLSALTLLEDLRPTRSCDPRLIFMEARVYEVIGEPMTAIRLYKSLIKLFPNMPEPYNNLAQLYASQGDIVEAEKLLLRGLSTHSTYQTIQHNLTTVYVARAAHAYQQALNIKQPDKTPLDIQPGLGLIHAEQLQTSWEPAPLPSETDCISP